MADDAEPLRLWDIYAAAALVGMTDLYTAAGMTPEAAHLAGATLTDRAARIAADTADMLVRARGQRSGPYGLGPSIARP